MSNFPWLTVAGAIPLAGALVISLIPRRPAPAGEASRPSTSPSASISTHFLSISAGLAENVFIGERPKFRPQPTPRSAGFRAIGLENQYSLE